MDTFVNTMTSAAAAVAGLADQINDLKLGKRQYNYYVQGLEKSAELQHKENLFWADYNTPASQMQRLKAAGLNPNLVYDNGANAQFSGSVSPSGSMPNFRGGYGKNLISMQNMMAQNENLRAQNEVLSNEANLKQEQAREASERADAQAWQNEKNRSRGAENVGRLEDNAMRSEFERNVSQSALNESNARLNNINADIRETFGSLSAELELTAQDIANKINQFNYDHLPEVLQKDLNLKSSQIASFIASAAEARSFADKAYEEINRLKIEEDNLRKEGKRIDAETRATRIRSIEATVRTTGQRLENKLRSIGLKYEDAKQYSDLLMRPIYTGIRLVGGVNNPLTKAAGH